MMTCGILYFIPNLNTRTPKDTHHLMNHGNKHIPSSKPIVSTPIIFSEKAHRTYLSFT